MIVKFTPTHDECCSCIDDQITFKEVRDCNVCKEKHKGVLAGIVRKWRKTCAVVQYGDKLMEYPIESIEVIEP